MKVRSETWSSVIAALVVAVGFGCSSSKSNDGGPGDSGPTVDSGPADSGTPDSGEIDAGEDAGQVPNIGSHCGNDLDCVGSNPTCLVLDAGYPQGYCTQHCTQDSECGPNGVCIDGLIGPLSDGGAEKGCLQGCSATVNAGCPTENSDAGTATGPSNYVCVTGLDGDAGQSVCFPNCTDINICQAGTLCDTTTGDCAPPPPPVTDAGTLTTITNKLLNPESLSQTGSTLFVAEYDPGSSPDAGNGAIVSASTTLSGSGPNTATTVAGSQPNATPVVSDGTNVYWVQQGTFDMGNYNNDGQILQAKLAGGTVTTLVASGILTSVPVGIAVNSSTVFFAVQGTVTWGLGANCMPAQSNGMILSVPIGGGTLATIEQNRVTPSGIAADETNVYWTDVGSFNLQLSHGACAYEYKGNGAVLQAPVAGGTVTTLAGGLFAPNAIAIDATNVYGENQGHWGVEFIGDEGYIVPAPNTGSIIQIPIGGTTVTTIANNVNAPSTLAVGSTDVYWSILGSVGVGTLFAGPIGGGTVKTIATQLTQPTALVASGTSVFICDYGTGDTDGAVLEFTPAN